MPLKCLTTLRNRYRSYVRRLNQQGEKRSIDEEKMSESRVFVELTSYIEKAVESGVLLFKLFEIHSLYVNHFAELGILKSINKIRFKDLLLKHFPGAQDRFDGTLL